MGGAAAFQGVPRGSGDLRCASVVSWAFQVISAGPGDLRGVLRDRRGYQKNPRAFQGGRRCFRDTGRSQEHLRRFQGRFKES